MADISTLLRLSALIASPRSYVDRIEEVVTFPERGGLCWQRSIQLTVPTLPRDDPANTDAEPCVISLGLFKPRRLGDMRVQNEKGHTLPLLTRMDHARLMTAIVMRQFFGSDLSAARSLRQDLTTADHLRHFELLLRQGFRDGPWESSQDADLFAYYVSQRAWELARSMGLRRSIAADKSKMIRSMVGSLAGATHYLCWCDAVPGQKLNLTASWTTEDQYLEELSPTPFALEVDRKRVPPSEWDKWGQWWYTSTTGLLDRTRYARALGYTRRALQPVEYNVGFPTTNHTASYYFSIEPPVGCRVSLLDWKTGRVFGDRLSSGIVSARVPTFHQAQPHDAGDDDHLPAAQSAELIAFIRPDFESNATLVAVGLVSLALAAMAQSGAFVVPEGESSPAGTLVYLAPAAILGYLGAQRRHYYSALFRPLRSWLLATTVLLFIFGSSVAFDPVHDDNMAGIKRTDVLDDVLSAATACAGLLLIISVAVTRRDVEVRVRKHIRRALVHSATWDGAWTRWGRIVRRPRRSSTIEIEAAEREAKTLEMSNFAVANAYRFFARRTVDRAAIASAIIVVTMGLSVGGALPFTWGAGRDAAAKKAQTTTPPPPVEVKNPVEVRGKVNIDGGHCSGKLRSTRSGARATFSFDC